MAALMTESTPYVMMRWYDRPDASPDDVIVIGIYPDLEAVEARLRRIAAANKKYPMRKIGPTQWEIGPEEDQGLFGDPVVRFTIQQPKGVQ